MMQLSRLANCALFVLVAVLFDVGLAASFENGADKREQATRTFISKNKDPFQLILDDWGNQILHFTFKDLPPYAHRVVTIKADLMLADIPNPAQDNNLNNYLSSEKHFEGKGIKVLINT